jgi:UDP-N-acetylglucosamine transferase subunit ALG13
LIFVTVGANTPFDRLVRCVDGWAATRESEDVFAQIGRTDYRPAHLRWTELLPPEDFRKTLVRASVIVAHAGMGTILSALEAGIPILVMPRSAALREMRTDHQFATARRLAERGLVHVALDEDELRRRLDELVRLDPAARIAPVAPAPLIERLRTFIAASPSGSASKQEGER